jgi:hypothetical protein
VRPLRDSPRTARRSRGSEPQKPHAPTACGGGAGVLPATATRRTHRPFPEQAASHPPSVEPSASRSSIDSCLAGMMDLIYVV